jgi:hypothetical protein
MKFSKIILAGTMTLFASAAFAAENSDFKAPIVPKILPNPGLNAQVNILPMKKYKTETSYEVLELPKNARFYYDGDRIEQAGVIITDPNKVTIDPDDGDLTVFFSYKARHSDGQISEPRMIIMRFADLQISGSVYYDFDGNAKVGGESITHLDGEPLFVTLVNKENMILSSKALSPEGTFSFNNRDGIQPNSHYRIVVGTKEGALSSLLPMKWASSGENINSLSKGRDKHKDGAVLVPVKEKNIADIAFGLDIRPLAISKKHATQPNPGLDNHVPVPELEGSDKEDGKAVRYYIISLPDNAVLYDNGKKVTTAGKEIKHPGKMMLDPKDGDQKVHFTYVTADSAGVVSPVANIEMTFAGLKISGKIFNDGDGKKPVSGKPISQIDGEALYVTLINAKNSILGSQAVDESGRFHFDGTGGIVPESQYKIILSTKRGAKTSTLTKAWNNSDEGVLESGEGHDGVFDGKITVDLGIKDVSNVNFGINKKPEVETITVPAQVNPGSAKHANVPVLMGKDNENSHALIYSITTLPENGDLYYEDRKITKEGFVVKDPSKLRVDPQNGEISLSFSYKVTDTDAVSSDPAEVKLSFSELRLSGHLFADGNDDDNVSGDLMHAIDRKPIYVLLLNTRSELLSTKKISREGSYLFDGKDGVEPGKQFFIALATAPNTSAFGLPEGWNHTGEKINSLETAKNQKAEGVISVIVDKSNVTDIDFGINQKPRADALVSRSQLNPGRNTRVPVATLTGNDRESGKDLVYQVASLPALGTLYYDDEKIDNIGFVVEKPDHLMLDPDNSDKIVLFSYVAIDEAGVSSDPQRVQMPFSGLTISGRVVNDGDGDEKVKGKSIKIPKNLKPYATLLDENNTILASNPLRRDGSFSFNGEDGVYPNAIFSIVVSLEANATSAVLPSGWHESGKTLQKDSNTSELSNPDGKITIQVRETNRTNIEFGLNKEPTADNKTVKSQVNPGGETRVNVPTLSGDDRESVRNLEYMITKVPDNATLYDKGIVVSNNDLVDPAYLTLNPKDGTLLVMFSYVTVDSEKLLSEQARVSMSFAGLSISGTIFEDFIMDGVVDSVQTAGDDKIKLFMTLLNNKGDILASVPVQKDGTYLFDPSMGVNANTTYTVVLSKDANSTVSILPGGYNYADGENINSLGSGTDGKADGMIDVSVKSIDLKKVDFSVNYLIQ